LLLPYKYLYIRWLAIDKTGLAIINNQLNYHMKNGHEITTEEWSDISVLLNADAPNGIKNNVVRIINCIIQIRILFYFFKSEIEF